MKKLPNNPLKAYQVGKVEGTKDNMDLVSMALLDKCGWHLRSEDAEDRQSIEFLFLQMTYYAKEINEGRIKRRDVRKMLEEEQKLFFEE